MRLNAVEVTQSLLAYTVVNDKQRLISLLERNGVNMPQNAGDNEVTAAAVLASSRSQNFKNELAKLLTSKAEEAGERFEGFIGQQGMSFTGIDDFSFTGYDDFMNGPGPVGPIFTPKQLENIKKLGEEKPKSGKKDKSGAGKALAGVGKFLKENILTKENINAGVQIGLTSINNKAQSKANGLQAESAAIIEKQDEIRRNQAGAAGKKLSTGAWIGIGVGVIAVVGLAIYLIKKK